MDTNTYYREEKLRFVNEWKCIDESRHNSMNEALDHLRSVGLYIAPLREQLSHHCAWITTDGKEFPEGPGALASATEHQFNLDIQRLSNKIAELILTNQTVFSQESLSHMISQNLSPMIACVFPNIIPEE